MQLYDYWARTAHHEFQGIPRDAFFYARAADALLMFFQCVQRGNRPCALPSKAADSVWHAWLRWSPASLDDFCERHFGRRIPHVEAGDMAGGMEVPIAASLVTARRLDGLPGAGPHVPRLFATIACCACRAAMPTRCAESALCVFRWTEKGNRRGQLKCFPARSRLSFSPSV